MSPGTGTLVQSYLKNKKFYPLTHNIHIYFIIVCGEE
jgi:hypothetical protein